jgi:hypothetical protein
VSGAGEGLEGDADMFPPDNRNRTLGISQFLLAVNSQQ